MLEWILQLDQKLLLFINRDLSNSFFDRIMPAITDLHKASWFKVIVPLLLFLLFCYKFRLKKGSLIFVGLLVSLGLSDFLGNQLFKQTVQRARPGDTPSISVQVRSPYGGYSFVSNHATNMFNLATYTASFIPGSQVILYPTAALIAYSRVYNGVHFPLDVICGGLFGSMVGMTVTRLVRSLLKRIKEEKK